MRSAKMVVFCLCLLALGQFSGQALAEKNLTAKLQAKYDGITSMRADFSQVLLHKESGAKETRTGTLQFKKPLLVRWETKDPSPELLVVGKTEIWNVFPDEDAAYKYPLSLVEDTRSIVRVVTGQSRLEQDFTFEKEGTENGLTKLHVYPKEPVQALVEAIFWVDPESALIRKLRIYDFYGNENEITFTNQQIDVAVPDASFAYKPGKGITVEDRTKQDSSVQKPLMQ